MTKQLKDQTIKDFTIKIDRVIGVKKMANGVENTDKMFLVNIVNSYGEGIGFSVKASRNYGSDLRKVFRRIKEELNL